jgi:hypothetical protein
MVSLSSENKAEMQRLVAGLPTKSAKIRRLAEAGYERADIARFLGIRYQHVRNVLTHAPQSATTVTEPAVDRGPGASEEAASFAAEGSSEAIRVYRFNVDTEGRIKLPSDALTALDAVPRRLITARFEDGELKLMSIDAAVRFVQRLAEPYIKEGEGNWSDQVIAERRAEAEREAEEDRS